MNSPRLLNSKNNPETEVASLYDATTVDGASRPHFYFDREAAEECKESVFVGSDDEKVNICSSVAAAQRFLVPVATVCVILLTVMAISYSMYFCKPVMLPITGAFLLNFLFSPVVARLHRWGVPNAVGALLILIVSIGLIVLSLLFAYDPAKDWLADREKNLVVFESKLRSLQEPLDQIRDVSEKIDELAEAKPVKDGESEKVQSDQSNDQPTEKPGAVQSAVTQPDSESADGEILPTETGSVDDPDENEQPSNLVPLVRGSSDDEGIQDEGNQDEENQDEGPASEDEAIPVPSQPVPVEVRQPSISKRIFSGTGDVLVKFSLMIVLLFYLLASGDRGLEKLVALMPNWKQKRRIVELSRAIEKSISAYLLTTTVINFFLGVVIGLGMWMLGMPNPILWGVMAMLLNFFPFVGCVVGAAVVFGVGVVSFDSLMYAALAPTIYLVANLIEANFITPILLGRSVSLHPVWLMIWFVIVSWVWGFGGAIVAVPLLAVIKIISDHIEPLMPIGAFLGR